MSTDTIQIDLKDREVLGKGLTKLRVEGQIPAVVHDHGKDSLHVMADVKVISKVYSEAGKHHPVELKIGSKQRLALIKDVDFEPTRHEIRHVVFQSIKQDEKVSAEIPIRMLGDEIPAEKKSLLVLQQLDHVVVEALPKDLPDEVTVDGMKLEEVGDSLSVADLVVPAGVTIMTDPTNQIAIVEMPKDQIAEADAAAESLAEDAASTSDAEGEEAAPAEGTEETGEAAPAAESATKEKE
jgi:large subunit ribosomal protein L25